MIKVAIVDDHPMVLEGIRQMLSSFSFIEVRGTYANAHDLLYALPAIEPDIILLDIQMEGIKGDEATFKITTQFPNTKVIAVTNFDSLLYISNMLKNGANGYLLKTTSQENLIDAIQTVAAGGTYIEPILRAKTEKALEHANKNKYHKISLTLREIEIVKRLVAGCSNQQIAEQLFISYNTMRNHRARIFFKLDVNTIGELVKKAMELGIA